MLSSYPTYIGNQDGADDGSLGQIPQPQGVIRDFTKTRLQDGKGNNEIGGQNDVFVPIDAQTVRIEVVSKYIDVGFDIFRVLGDDVELVIGFDQATGGGSCGG